MSIRNRILEKRKLQWIVGTLCDLTLFFFVNSTIIINSLNFPLALSFVSCFEQRSLFKPAAAPLFGSNFTLSNSQKRHFIRSRLTTRQNECKWNQMCHNATWQQDPVLLMLSAYFQGYVFKRKMIKFAWKVRIHSSVGLCASKDFPKGLRREKEHLGWNCYFHTHYMV